MNETELNEAREVVSMADLESAMEYHARNPPTSEQLRARSARWLKPLEPCLYENWPQALKDLSFPTQLMELTADDQKTMEGFWSNDTDKAALGSLSARITAVIQGFAPGGCFVKLSSRSPKDATAMCEEAPLYRDGNRVLSTFAFSERILEDLAMFRHSDAKCYLLLRKFCVIPEHQEFRCMIRDGRVAGVSQYNYFDAYPELLLNRDDVRGRVFAFLDEKVVPNLHIRNVVVDVWLQNEPYQTVMIEINPYGLSDPCLFDYAELDSADRAFRVREE